MFKIRGKKIQMYRCKFLNKQFQFIICWFHKVINIAHSRYFVHFSNVHILLLQIEQSIRILTSVNASNNANITSVIVLISK